MSESLNLPTALDYKAACLLLHARCLLYNLMRTLKVIIILMYVPPLSHPDHVKVLVKVFFFGF